MEKASKAVLGTPASVCLNPIQPCVAPIAAGIPALPAALQRKAAGCAAALFAGRCAAEAAFPVHENPVRFLRTEESEGHFFYHLYPQRNTSGTSHAPNDAAHRHTACTQQFSEERPHHRCLSPLRVYVRFREILHTEKRLSPAAHGFAAAPHKARCRA